MNAIISNGACVYSKLTGKGEDYGDGRATGKG